MHYIRLEHGIWLIFPLENLLSVVNGFIRSRLGRMALLIATKAHLVDRSFTQEYEIDYEETFALVARLSFVRTLIAISAAFKWPLFQIDVKNSFLNGELSEEVYMKLPLGYSHPSGFPHRVCRLRHTLYSLKQAP